MSDSFLPAFRVRDGSRGAVRTRAALVLCWCREREAERKNCGLAVHAAVSWRPQFYTATARPGGQSFSRFRGAGERPKRIAMDCHVATLLAVTEAYGDAATVAVKII